MADPVGALRVELSASIAKFLTDMDKAAKGTAKFKKDVDGFGASFAQAFTFKGVAAGFTAITAAAAATAFGIGKLVGSAVQTGDAYAKLSQKTGESTEFLSGLTHAANLSNVSQEQLGVGLRQLAVNMSQAASGTGDSAKAFAQLGVTVKNADGTLRPTGQVLLDVADKLAGMKDAAQRAALAQQFFGRSGVELLPLLAQGSAAIRLQMEDARQLGLVWSTETAAAAEQLNDNLNRLQGVGTGLVNLIGSTMIPVVNEIAEEVLTWFKANQDLIKQGLEQWATATASALKDIANVLVNLSSATLDWHSEVGALIGLFSKSLQFIGNVIRVIFDAIAGTITQAAINISRLLELIPVIGKHFKDVTKQIEGLQGAIFDTMQANSAKLLRDLGLMGEEEVQQHEKKEKRKTDATMREVAVRVAALTSEQKAEEALGRVLQQIAARENKDAVEALQARAEAHAEMTAQQFKIGQASSAQARQAAIDLVDVQLAEATRRATEEGKSIAFITSLEEKAAAKRMGIARQFPTFWETQLQDLVNSNSFSLSSIVSTWTSSISQMIVKGGNLKAAWEATQIALVQAALNTGVQLVAQWVLQELQRAAATEAANAAIVTSNVTAATTTASAWAVVAAGLKAVFLTMAAAMKAIMISLAHAVVGLLGIVVGAIATVLQAIGFVLQFALTAIADLLFAAASAVQVIPIIGQILGAIIFAAGVFVQGLAIAVPAIVAGFAALLVGSVAALGAAIPAMQEGGIVTRPTLALIGEAGPEAVIPLKDTRGMGGQRTIIIEVDRRQLARWVAPEMVHELRLRLGTRA